MYVLQPTHSQQPHAFLHIARLAIMHAPGHIRWAPSLVPDSVFRELSLRVDQGNGLKVVNGPKTGGLIILA
jgi:hypothetical protein